MNKLTSKYIDLNKLTPHPQNVRVGNVDLIKQSLQHHGQYRPIVAQTSTHHILAGNHTFKAAQELGWTEIAVTLIDCDNDQALRILLMDNRANDKATYDTDELVSLLDQLLDTDLELTGTGFSMGDLDELLADIDTPDKDLGDVDEVPEPPKEPVTQLGDVWLLGKHRVMCGKSDNELSFAKLLNGNIMDAVVTDPPYGINANKQTMGNGKKDFHRGKGWDDKAPDVSYLLNLAPTQIIWGGNYFTDVLPPTNHWLIWYKKIANVSFSECELAWTNLGKQTRLLEHHWSGETKQHVTMKPLPVMTWCLQYLKENAHIIDPYAGSGTTLIAAEQTNRTAYLMELDPQYVDVICKRYQQTTGTTPILEATNKPHNFLVE